MSVCSPPDTMLGRCLQHACFAPGIDFHLGRVLPRIGQGVHDLPDEHAQNIDRCGVVGLVRQSYRQEAYMQPGLIPVHDVDPKTGIIGSLQRILPKETLAAASPPSPSSLSQITTRAMQVSA